jgi:hypothetical protein
MAGPRPFDSTAPLRPGPDELHALAEKYRALAALRDRKDGGDDTTTRATLRALSQRHPGALRELDTLGTIEIQRRAQAAAAAAAGGPHEPWMAWIAAYHRLTAAALMVKRELGGGLPGERADALAERASREAGLVVDAALVGALARPPRGRMAPVVFGFLAQLFGVPAAQIAATLFPARRPSPYTLP